MNKEKNFLIKNKERKKIPTEQAASFIFGLWFFNNWINLEGMILSSFSRVSQLQKRSVNCWGQNLTCNKISPIIIQIN
jgi:hypothetical protein